MATLNSQTRATKQTLEKLLENHINKIKLLDKIKRLDKRKIKRLDNVKGKLYFLLFNFYK
jgi:hypothetical protein